MYAVAAFVVVFAGLTIFVTCDAYALNKDLKRFKKGITIAIVLMGIVIIGSIGVIMANII